MTPTTSPPTPGPVSPTPPTLSDRPAAASPDLEASDLLADHQGLHSDFQIDCFIVEKSSAGTTWGRYRQALREIHKRVRGLETLRIDVEIAIEEGEELSGPKRSRKEVEIRNLRDSIQETERELSRFVKHARRLKWELGVITPERRAKLDAEFWRKSIEQRAAIDLVTCGRLSPPTVEMLLAVPPAMRLAILEEFQKDPAGLTKRAIGG